MVEVTSVTLMVIDEHKVIEGPNGEVILPQPHRLLDVTLENRWLAQALQTQRECMATEEPYVVRMFDDRDMTQAPIFAVAILSVPAVFSAFVTNDQLGN